MLLLRDQVVALRRGQKRGVGILCAEWRKEETEELTAWFHLSLARGHAEPVVAQNGVCSAVRQINLCRLENQQGSAGHTCTYYLYTISVYCQLVHMILLMFGHHQHRNLLSKRGHSRQDCFHILGMSGIISSWNLLLTGETGPLYTRSQGLTQRAVHVFAPSSTQAPNS